MGCQREPGNHSWTQCVSCGERSKKISCVCMCFWKGGGVAVACMEVVPTLRRLASHSCRGLSMIYGDSLSLLSLVSLYSGGISSGSTGSCRAPQYYAIQFVDNAMRYVQG